MDYLLLLFYSCVQTIGHHFGFHGLRFLKPSYVSIVALLPRPEGIGDSLYRFISKIKERRCSLVQFISCPRVARSYFLCDSISAAGTLTQDSLLLLPSHNTTCNFRESTQKLKAQSFMIELKVPNLNYFYLFFFFRSFFLD